MKPYDYLYADLIKVVKVISSDGITAQCLPCNYNGSVVAEADRAITCYSLNGVYLIENKFYIAFQVEKDRWVIHNQSVFLEFL